MTTAKLSKFALVAPTDPCLNKAAAEIEESQITSPEIQEIIDYMFALSAGKGHDKEDSRQMVGLAAPQIGVSKRIITIDVTADGANKQQTLQVFINPKITSRSAKTIPGREGCWSCGNICGNVERTKEVTLEGLDRSGTPIKARLKGFVARIAQHETDHLDGIRFPDRIPIDQPERLHWVLPSEFDEYRKNWMHRPKLCPRERWESMKAGGDT